MLLTALFAGCGTPTAPVAPPSHPDVVLVTLDTTRADRLAPYGFSMARTPNLSDMARDGTLFEHHYTTAPITLPAHISVMTGLVPPRHGVRDNGVYALPDQATTLAEMLKAQGYATGAFVSAMVLDSTYNLDQGFDVYDDDLAAEDDPPMFMIRDRPGVRTADALSEWIRPRLAAPRGERPPVFAWMHVFDPHHPWEPDPIDRIRLPTPYDAEITGADRAVGRVLEALREANVLDDTLVVVTADHGESLGEHGEKTHAVFIYDSTMHVPLIMRWPGHVPAGLRVTETTSAVDIVPTVLSLLGLPAADVDGLDVSPTFAGAALPEREVYMESMLSERGFGMAPLHGVRRGEDVFIRAPRSERYDVAVDPRQLHDLHPEAPAPGLVLDEALQRILDASSARALTPEADPQNAATEETLMALGYLAPASDRAAVQGMDPKDGLPLHTLLEDARHLVQAGDTEAAEVKLAELLEKTPANTSALNVLAMIHARKGRPKLAEATWRSSLAADPRQYRVYLSLADLARRRKDYAGARAHVEQAMTMVPDLVEGMVALGVLAHLEGDAAGAEAWHAKATAVDPENVRIWRDIGDLRFRQEHWDEAITHYERVLASSPRDHRARLHLGTSHLRAGRPEASLPHFEKAAALRPDHWMAPYNAACGLALLGRSEEALVKVEAAVAAGDVPRKALLLDPDLTSIRQEPRFQALLAKLAQEKVDARGATPTLGILPPQSHQAPGR
ncbi:MAG: sulfatase-like hydrolase/transferase [Alphaproteobacteria bacterium]|nr:sulfatase-like hydrolase/transferase [Alphaproteobacteria bacterium]